MTEKDVYDFLSREVAKPENFYEEVRIDDTSKVREYRLMLGESVGVCAAYLLMGPVTPVLVYSFPFYETFDETSQADCVLERHTATETYSGIIDDLAPGISLIFYMINSLDMRRKLILGADPLAAYHGVYLSAFANEGKVLLPIARTGDETPFQFEETEDDMALAEEQVFLYDRIQNEDLYTLVDQTFIPWGVECDQYSIVGEITEVGETVNTFTGIPMWLMAISCNDVHFRLCMRKDDLLGEPAQGRRIKCGIWLHGHVNIENV